MHRGMERPDRVILQSKLERRETVRLNGPFAVSWTIATQGVSGTGVIRDLSADGICLQLDREFRIDRGTLLLSLRSPEIAVLPTEARLRWFRRPARNRFQKPAGFLCGCIFNAPTRAWIEWYTQAVARQVAAAAAAPPEQS